MTPHLAQELWYLVFSFLDFRSLSRVQVVCSSFNELGAANNLWRSLCLRYFAAGNIFFPVPTETQDYKLKFKRILGVDVNGNWTCYSMQEGHEQEEFLQHKSIFLSTDIEKGSGLPMAPILPPSHFSSSSPPYTIPHSPTSTTSTTSTATETLSSLYLVSSPPTDSIIGTSTTTTTTTTRTNETNLGNESDSKITESKDSEKNDNRNKRQLPDASHIHTNPTHLTNTPKAQSDPINFPLTLPVHTSTITSSSSVSSSRSYTIRGGDNEDNTNSNKKRRVTNNQTQITNTSAHHSLYSHAFLGVGKASWGDIVVMGSQWGQYHCCVQLYFHNNFRTVYLYEVSPSGRVMLGVFFSNWFNLIGLSAMCEPETPKETAMQVMTHAWNSHHSTHKWEGLLGEWVITFTYSGGRQQVFTFSVKTQRRMGFSGIIKGIYSKPSEIPTMARNTLHYNYADYKPREFKHLRTPNFGHNGNEGPRNESSPVAPSDVPLSLGHTPETQHPEKGGDDDVSIEEYDSELDEEELEEEEEDDNEDPQGGTHSPSLLGTVTGKLVGMSFYTIGGTAFGKFITCVGQIESDPNKFEQILRVAPDDYAIREVTLRGYFTEKLLNPHADDHSKPRVEEGTWRAVRRTRTFQADRNY